MHDHGPSRRQFLAAGLAAAATATAGCLDAFVGGADEQRSLSLSLTRRDDPLRDRYVVDLAETRPEWDEDAFHAALNGRAYTTQYRKPFFSSPGDPKYVLRDGTYYRLGSAVVDEVAVERPVLRLYEAADGDGQATPDGDAVAAEDLPESDQAAVFAAYTVARARGNQGGVPWGMTRRGGAVYRDEDAIAASRLLADDGPDEVVFRRTRYDVAVDRERFHEPVYRATVEPVAESPERMEAILRAKFVRARFTSEDLSADARDVLREARAGGYDESHPYSAGYRDVLRALDERAYLDGNVEKDAPREGHGRGTVLFDGTYVEYWLQFSGGASGA